jgi:RNA polymerase sigma-70 factor (sigma-E family)
MVQHHDTFAEFVNARSTALMRTAFMLTGDTHEAEDLVQSALLKAAQVWPRIEASPEPYVRQIIYHENISNWRRRRIREVTMATTPDATAVSVDADARLMVLAALRQLTRRQRAVLVLRYFEDLTEVQTARALGIRVGTVKSQTRQALDRLRKLAPELSDLRTTAGDVT